MFQSCLTSPISRPLISGTSTSQLWRQSGAESEKSDLQDLMTLKEDGEISFPIFQLTALCRLLLSRLPALSHVFAESGANAEIYGRKPNQWNTYFSTALRIHTAGNAALARDCATPILTAPARLALVKSLGLLTT